MTIKEQAQEEQRVQRKRYMDGKLSHKEYYIWLAEFIGVNKSHVPFSQERIDKSNDEYLNDLPLRVWDCQHLPIRQHAYAKGLAWSTSDTVCVLKVLARS